MRYFENVPDVIETHGPANCEGSGFVGLRSTPAVSHLGVEFLGRGPVVDGPVVSTLIDRGRSCEFRLDRKTSRFERLEDAAELLVAGVTSLTEHSASVVYAFQKTSVSARRSAGSIISWVAFASESSDSPRRDRRIR